MLSDLANRMAILMVWPFGGQSSPGCLLRMTLCIDQLRADPPDVVVVIDRQLYINIVNHK